MKTTIGAKIEEYFDYLGYNYQELQGALGIDRSQADLIFSNKVEVSQEQLQRWATLFNTTVDILQNGKSLNEEAQAPVNLDMSDLTDKDQLEIGKFNHYLLNKK